MIYGSTRQRVQSGWLILSGLGIVGFVIWSIILRTNGQEDLADDMLGWAIIIMLASVWVSTTIQYAWPARNEVAPCCECCERERRGLRLPPTPQPGDPPNLRKV
jgi:hypothetical protein